MDVYMDVCIYIMKSSSPLHTSLLASNQEASAVLATGIGNAVLAIGIGPPTPAVRGGLLLLLLACDGVLVLVTGPPIPVVGEL
jgi:hypothetical protein